MSVESPFEMSFPFTPGPFVASGGGVIAVVLLVTSLRVTLTAVQVLGVKAAVVVVGCLVILALKVRRQSVPPCALRRHGTCGGVHGRCHHH